MTFAMHHEPTAGRRFETTRWSLVLEARGPDARKALETLCQSYWHPVQAFFCSKGVPTEEAGDLTQGFFAMLVERGDVANLKRGECRFRTWLKACAKHYFLADLVRKRAIRRGGGAVHLSVEEGAADGSLQDLSDSGPMPDKAFDRSWAITVTEHARSMLRERYASRGMAERFAQLEGSIGGKESEATDREIADALGEPYGNIRSYRKRLKEDYRKCVRKVILETVVDPELVDAEMRDLFDALS
jgi:RNA polymerase sigma-70 factor (ECF subfamily)